MTARLQALVDNVTNGNLGDAKRQAKRFADWRIRGAFRSVGYSLHKATLAADWLKGRDCWRELCEADLVRPPDYTLRNRDAD